MVVDPYGRPVTSVRIAVTQACNLHCFYCHREGEHTFSRANVEMTPEELVEITRVLESFDVRRVKLTGGEPLTRADILDIVEGISRVRGIYEVSMTTNGTLLTALAEPLKDHGLTRVNVSLDSLNPDAYANITGKPVVEKVVQGIERALEVGLNPVKVNMVLLKDVNDDQVWNMIRYARRTGVCLQIIELEAPTEDPFFKRYHSDVTAIERQLRKRATNVTVRRMHHRRVYCLPGPVKVEIVQPMHNTEFCQHCTRIRITSDGKFKPCLFRADNHIDFLTAMRRGASSKELAELFVEAVRRRRPYFTPFQGTLPSDRTCISVT